MSLIYVVMAIALISIISLVDASYVSVGGIKAEQEKNNYISFILSKRSVYNDMILSDGSLGYEDDKKQFIVDISGDEKFGSPILSDSGVDGYYLCIEKLNKKEKISAAKDVVKTKPNIVFFISDCNDYKTKSSEYKDGDYIAFLLK